MNIVRLFFNTLTTPPSYSHSPEERRWDLLCLSFSIIKFIGKYNSNEQLKDLRAEGQGDSLVSEQQ